MIHLTRAMEFVTTKTETEALLLEINLIEQLKPRASTCSCATTRASRKEILIRRDHPATRIKKYREARFDPRRPFRPSPRPGR